MSLVLSIAAHGDPSQVPLWLLYPEQCECCDRSIYDRRPRQRFHPDCLKARRLAAQRRRYRRDADYRAERLANASRYYHTRRRATA